MKTAKKRIRVGGCAYSNDPWCNGVVHLEERSGRGYICRGIGWSCFVPRSNLVPLSNKHKPEICKMVEQRMDDVNLLNSALVEISKP